MNKRGLKNRQVKRYIRKTVIETMREIFSDPDYGLPLTRETVKRLKKSQRSKKEGRLIDFEEILKEYQ